MKSKPGIMKNASAMLLLLSVITCSLISPVASAQKDTTQKVILKPIPIKIDPKVITRDPMKGSTTKPVTGESDVAKNIIYVKWDATGSNNGTSWLNAYTSLQTALGAATAGKTIWVARGTYKPATTLDRMANFRVKNNVSMYGGFAGTETNIAARVIASNPTLLDGDIGMAGNVNDNSYNILYVKGAGSTTIISGFTIQNANANQVTQIKVSSSGGGIYIEGSLAGTSPVFKQCTIKDNRATWGGGLMITCNQVRDPDNGGGNPVFDTCTFSNNRSSNMGGAVYIDSYWQVFNPKFRGCTFETNTSTDGGAIYHQVTMGASSPVYENCIFSHNTVNGRRGAAVSNIFGSDIRTLTSADARPVYSGCTFRDNDATSFGQGMMYNGMYGRTYTIEIKNCVFESTSTASTITRFSHTGGAFHNETLAGGNLVLNVSNSIFNKLKCGGNGGVIFNFSNGGTSISSNFTNCHFSDNLGCDGGVLYANTEGTGSITTCNFYNCIFWYNYFQPGSAGHCGHGEDISLETAGSTANLVNCLTNKSDCDVMKYGAGRMTCTATIFATDPLFTDYAAGNFRPQATSPLIDAGNDTYTTGFPKDFLGATRRLGAHVDIGPYEVR
jgi:hypothetical protein